MPMPSEVVDQKGSSSLSSYFSDDVRLENETLQRQVKCWNSANMPDYHGVVSCRLMKNTTTHHKSAGSGTVASSSLEKLLPAEQNSLKSVDHHHSFLFKDQKVELISNKQSVGLERKGSHSTNLLKTDSDIGTQSLQPSYLAQRNKFNVIGAQCESSLFSSSLSELFTKRVTLSSNNALYGHSFDTVASHYEEEEPLESIEELEAQTIGNLLPNDDDLLSGLTDGVDYVLTQNEGEDTEDLDFFSNVGGMDLGDEDLSMGLKNSEFYGVSHGQQVTSNGSIGVEHPLGEHPSRTLFVRNISSSVEDSELRALFEQYGDIHTLYTACKHRGFVMISYYDIRGAQNAMKALQNKPLRRRKLDIHFSIPKDPSEKDINHGSFVVLNLDSKISNDELFHIFGAYGEVKEVKEVPHRSCHKIIEFYDIRAAEGAVRALNWGDILGKQIKLEPNYPVGGRWSLAQQFHPEMEKEDISSYLQQNSSPMNSAMGLSGLNSKVSNICSSVDNGSLLGLHSALRLKSLETASNNGISSSVPINLSSQMRAESIANKSAFVDSGHSPSLLKFQAAHAFHPHSLPEYHDGFHGRVHFNTREPTAGNISLQSLEKMDNHQQLGISSNGNAIALSEAFVSGGKGNCSLPGHKYTWGNSYHPHPTGMVWPNSPSYVNGIRPGHPPSQLQGVPRAPAHMIPSVLPISNHYVGSAPSVNPSFWDRHNPYVVESPEFSGFLPGSLGNRKISNDSAHSIDFVSHIFAQAGGSCVDLPITERNVGLQPHHQRCMIFPGRNQVLPSMISFDYPSERSRSRRNESFSSHEENKKQYELDIDRIRLGEDIRTTLMIKNIPNKYTSKMLLAAIDEWHRGVYDFIYLPIDFKNKCNVGYAFINMTDPSLIIPFHETFNGKKWEKFNSEKVASLAYARIQGKAALVAHFQNSSLMNEDKRCRPILFNTEGPNAGDQVPFPTGVNVRTRPGKARSNACEESHSDSPYDSINGDDCFIEDTPYGSTKVSDPRPQQLDFCESLTNRTD